MNHHTHCAFAHLLFLKDHQKTKKTNSFPTFYNHYKNHKPFIALNVPSPSKPPTKNPNKNPKTHTNLLCPLTNQPNNNNHITRTKEKETGTATVVSIAAATLARAHPRIEVAVVVTTIIERVAVRTNHHIQSKLPFFVCVCESFFLLFDLWCV